MDITQILEVVEDYEEFKEKLNPFYSCHYNHWEREPRGTTHQIVFRIYAIGKDDQLLVFERRLFFPGPNKPRADEAVQRWVEELALPLGATLGRLRVLERKR